MNTIHPVVQCSTVWIVGVINLIDSSFDIINDNLKDYIQGGHDPFVDYIYSSFVLCPPKIRFIHISR